MKADLDLLYALGSVSDDFSRKRVVDGMCGLLPCENLGLSAEKFQAFLVMRCETANSTSERASKRQCAGRRQGRG